VPYELILFRLCIQDPKLLVLVIVRKIVAIRRRDAIQRNAAASFVHSSGFVAEKLPADSRDTSQNSVSPVCVEESGRSCHRAEARITEARRRLPATLMMMRPFFRQRKRTLAAP